MDTKRIEALRAVWANGSDSAFVGKATLLELLDALLAPSPAAEPVEPAQEPERCECGWRYAATREEGCVPGDCSMRSNRGSVTPAPAPLKVGDRVDWGRGTGKVIDPGPFAYVSLGGHEHFLPLADIRRVEEDKP